MTGNSKRWVFGTRTNKWYLVGKSDRDHVHGISQTKMKKIGKPAARKEYLRGRFIK